MYTDFLKKDKLSLSFLIIHYNMGSDLYNQKQYRKAIEQFSIVTKVNPSFSLAYYQWGLALHDQAKYNEAIEKYNLAINNDPQRQHPFTYYYLGLAYSSNGQNEEAINAFKQFLEFAPNSDLTSKTKEILNGLFKNSK